MIDRRRFVIAASLSISGSMRAAELRFAGLKPAFKQLEEYNGGRLGVAVLDLTTGERSGFRDNERFAMCSTFKFLLAAQVLRRIDRREEALSRAIAVPAKPLLYHSPLTEAHAGGSMTVAELVEAVLTQSDNTAANLLLESIGGPDSLTRFARVIGDTLTRLDRTETSLNEALAGDARDTTSPRSMTDNLNSVLFGRVLLPASRAQLTTWMTACETGLDRLRAKLPSGWRAADKTGANGEHTSNDIGVFWPVGRSPVIIAAYITQCQGPESKRAAMLAEIGRLVFQTFT
ncbi:MAG TPA: class A beta-lactamase [Steroidobacteraceae bacterium]